MAKRLTEEMVIARTKISDLSKIKRLNCWGSELVDVSLLRKMPSVEVLSLSINKIRSLADFQCCKRLEELYIRQNDIRDLNEIVYLQNLPNLKNLWLGENPCATTNNNDNYRLSVIKTLPQLQKLDNIQITQEELRDAQRRGKLLQHPDDEYEEDDDNVVVHQYQQNYNNEQDVEEEEEEEVEEYQPQQQQDYTESQYSPVQRSPPTIRPQQPTSPPRRAEAMQRRNYSPERQIVHDTARNNYERDPSKQPSQYYSRCPADNIYEVNPSCDNNYREFKLVNSQSANCLKDYTNGDRYQQSQQQQQQQYRQETSDAYGYERRDRYTCPAAVNHRPPPYQQRRPVTRNSNILSAVLRLVKELDYPSLEVVEMEVRSRMDELMEE